MEETLKHYQQAIKQLLNEYCDLSISDHKVVTVFDDERLHYLVLLVGWQGYKRIHQCMIHLQISDDGRVIIQCNDTEDLLDQRLVELGIPRNKIYLGMIPAEYQDEAA